MITNRKARGGKDLFSLQNKGGGKMKSKRYKTTHSTGLDMIEEMNRSKPQTIVNVSIRAGARMTQKFTCIP
jgi:hypothetical protein